MECESEEADGLVLYIFGKDDFPRNLSCEVRDRRPVVIAYARCEDQVRDIVLHAAAAKTVVEEYPELERDGVARKEARYRARAAEEHLKHFLADLFTPGHPDVCWHADKKVPGLKSHRDLSALLSELCDKSYNRCPVIQNELINRHKLSGAAARARRELLEAMLKGESLENLGLSGTGPEVAIYRTMILAEGFHRQGPAGLWRFARPEKKSS